MKEIFVFGSNLSGIHGAGSAKQAYMYHGAVRGQGEGLQGDSYALPTKGINITFMSLVNVAFHVRNFLSFVRMHPELQFKVTRVGCGLAGFTDAEIAPMFVHAPDNCMFDTAWQPIFRDMDKFPQYWGTF